jgi:hypothetical protein
MEAVLAFFLWQRHGILKGVLRGSFLIDKLIEELEEAMPLLYHRNIPFQPPIILGVVFKQDLQNPGFWVGDVPDYLLPHFHPDMPGGRYQSSVEGFDEPIPFAPESQSQATVPAPLPVPVSIPEAAAPVAPTPDIVPAPILVVDPVPVQAAPVVEAPAPTPVPDPAPLPVDPAPAADSGATPVPSNVPPTPESLFAAAKSQQNKDLLVTWAQDNLGLTLDPKNKREELETAIAKNLGLYAEPPSAPIEAPVESAAPVVEPTPEPIPAVVEPGPEPLPEPAPEVAAEPAVEPAPEPTPAIVEPVPEPLPVAIETPLLPQN